MIAKTVWPWVLLASCLLPLSAQAQAQAQKNQTSDEAWLRSHIGGGQAPGLIRRSGPRAADVSKMAEQVGRRARFTLIDGHERVGIIESVNEGQVRVRAQFGGGFFLYTLSQAEIRSLRLD